MENVKRLLAALTERLQILARTNAVVGRKVSVGERHLIPLCEVSVGFGGGGGSGEGTAKDEPRGTGGGAGGGGRAVPVAAILVDGDDVRVEILGR